MESSCKSQLNPAPVTKKPKLANIKLVSLTYHNDDRSHIPMLISRTFLADDLIFREFALRANYVVNF